MLYELLSEMLNQVVNEESTAMSAVRQSPYADQLIRSVHKQLGIAHNLDWQKITKITWNDVKEKSPNFILITGSEGTAAIRWSGTYEALVSYNEGITHHSSDTSSAIMTYVKAGLGKITGYWITTDTGRRPQWGRFSSNKVGDVEQKRAERKKSRKISTSIFDPNARYEQNFEALMRKLKPLWIRNIQQAIADVKGAAGIAIKNDAFNRATKKLAYAESLQELLFKLQDEPDSTEIPDKIKSALKYAVVMTAGHYYPDLTGNVNYSSSYSYRSAGGVTVGNRQGPEQVIQDIAGGDQEKMVAVLAYFKQVLLHP